MELYFIRHGQSINNVNWDNPEYIEHPDPYLTEIGLEQAEHLAKYLKERQHVVEHNGWNIHNQYGFGITHIYTSLMERAVKTAAPIIHTLEDVSFTAWTDIHEDGGIYAREEHEQRRGLGGHPRSFFETHFPLLKLPEHLDENGWWNNRPYESEDERQMRAENVLKELIVRHGDKEGQAEERVALVSHGEFFVRLVCVMLNIPMRQAAYGMRSWFVLNNCSLSRFDIRKDEILIGYLNRTEHLPPHLITG